MKKIIVALALGAVSVATAASAQGPVNARQLNQERRIDAGTRSGKLSPHEAARLKSQQHSISRQEDRLRARHGGHLTRRDKQIIHTRQARANQAILAKKHNRVRGKDHLKL
jgi:hypothetical protein